MADITWGFIGLGNIGYPIALNLRKKMKSTHKLIVMDLNKEAVQRFVTEVTDLAGSGHVGDKVWHMGEQSSGVRSKIVNNYILSINNIAAAEAMNMARKWGIDPVVLTDMLKVSTGRCWPVEVNNPVPGVNKDAPASNDYAPGGTVSIVKKDLGLAMADAKKSKAALKLAEAAWEVYDAVEKEHMGKDFSIVYQWLQRQI